MAGLSVYGASLYWVFFHAFYCNFGRAEEYRSLCEVRHKRVPYIGFHCNRQSPDMSLETSALIGSILIRYHLISQDWRGRRCVLIAKMNASFSENIYILWLKYLPRPTVCLYKKKQYFTTSIPYLDSVMKCDPKSVTRMDTLYFFLNYKEYRDPLLFYPPRINFLSEREKDGKHEGQE